MVVGQDRRCVPLSLRAVRDDIEAEDDQVNPMTRREGGTCLLAWDSVAHSTGQEFFLGESLLGCPLYLSPYK